MPTTYLWCEQAFSSLTEIKSTKRNRIVDVLMKGAVETDMLPRFDFVCDITFNNRLVICAVLFSLFYIKNS